MTTKPDYYEEGEWNALCSMCGGKFKSGELRKHWQGQWRCLRCWQPRHPQDFVRAGPPPSVPAFIQRPNDQYNIYCTPNGRTAIAGFGVAGCMQAGYISPFFDPEVTS